MTDLHKALQDLFFCHLVVFDNTSSPACHEGSRVDCLGLDENLELVKAYDKGGDDSIYVEYEEGEKIHYYCKNNNTRRVTEYEYNRDNATSPPPSPDSTFLTLYS